LPTQAHQWQSRGQQAHGDSSLPGQDA
jgi:hypothetical protein